jgi:hypothetical protein
MNPEASTQNPEVSTQKSDSTDHILQMDIFYSQTLLALALQHTFLFDIPF